MSGAQVGLIVGGVAACLVASSPLLGAAPAVGAMKVIVAAAITAIGRQRNLVSPAIALPVSRGRIPHRQAPPADSM